MAEPLYPSVEDQGEKRPLGFDVVAEPSGEPKSYTVEFTSSEKGTADEQRAPEASGGSEEIKLLERKSSSPEEKVNVDLSVAALCWLTINSAFVLPPRTWPSRAVRHNLVAVLHPPWFWLEN